MKFLSALSDFTIRSNGHPRAGNGRAVIEIIYSSNQRVCVCVVRTLFKTHFAARLIAAGLKARHDQHNAHETQQNISNISRAADGHTIGDN